MGIEGSFGDSFNGVDVLVSGHTGFKGSWLSIWLNKLGANVIGYSLDPPTDPSNFVSSGVGKYVEDIRGDVRDYQRLLKIVKEYQPKLIFHLAAQPLVLRSYEAPKETFDVNVGGTINILEAARNNPSVDSVICVTSDKCYENTKSSGIYSEGDRLGGHDPYSASKAMSELLISSYLKSFSKKTLLKIASARAGNVIGGGDFSENRLIPDVVRHLMKNEPVLIRNPHHVRPWQFVLEPLSGYLTLGSKLLGEGKSFEGHWNFGPKKIERVNCESIVRDSIQLWGFGEYEVSKEISTRKETRLLRLSSKKAEVNLGWHSSYNLPRALRETIEWYKAFSKNPGEIGSSYDRCVDDIGNYTEEAKELGLEWAHNFLR